MRDAFIDVLVEVSPSELRSVEDPTRHLFDLMRHRADEMCAESGARLRTDRAPEVEIRQGRHLLGFDVTLVASRWAVVAPESVELVR